MDILNELVKRKVIDIQKRALSLNFEKRKRGKKKTVNVRELEWVRIRLFKCNKMGIRG